MRIPSLYLLSTRSASGSYENLLTLDDAVNDAFVIKLSEYQLRLTLGKNELKL
ncbi:hypothetical protein [cyanobacterium endosymbiont of Epithemia clementina EcSB]|uniref:hypothetical protein n=1 Tax=cyanobacterium endosymbiont of Epithemia clementina EcSB TaxID=3034674 RepID=UPI0024809AA8|nr:hypothetical protein [cyanobacterium endosymbiont of Epithemia clementina EcSB]WGT68292.1 hypothetical protein P3F56_04340 [cyanobacterium endosymbiont of Epithemia clementina EcSB]